MAACSSESDGKIKQLQQRIEFARTLMEKARVFKTRDKIEGMQRIEKQIRAEISMLEKV